jgi:hypothetical protein
MVRIVWGEDEMPIYLCAHIESLVPWVNEEN